MPPGRRETEPGCCCSQESEAALLAGKSLLASPRLPSYLDKCLCEKLNIIPFDGRSAAFAPQSEGGGPARIMKRPSNPLWRPSINFRRGIGGGKAPAAPNTSLINQQYYIKLKMDEGLRNCRQGPRWISSPRSLDKAIISRWKETFMTL